ncbi:UDP-galactopyranose mutase [Caproiciproducens sp. LBM24188]
MDYLVVGCGLSGCVVARNLAERGHKVTIWERRDHVAGNMYDYVDSYGILVHKYGPHTFHTKKKDLYDYICRFASWEDYKLTCMAEIDGIVTPTPFNFQTIDDFYDPEQAMTLKAHIKAAFGDRQTATVVEVIQHEDPLIRAYGQFLFNKDYSLYTAKQWGVSPDKIDVSILQRVPLRFSYDVGYFDDEYQVMPRSSYTDFFKSLIDHPNITVEFNIDAATRLSIKDSQLFLDDQACPCPVVYTGALDELFDCVVGPLPYRSLHFEWMHEDIESKQKAPVVAYPQAEGYTRITEYKKLPVQKVRGTTYAVEYPLPYHSGSQSEPYYPVLTEESKRQYASYKKLANKVDNLYYCGRLADFKYYNMDQALERALELCNIL